MQCNIGKTDRLLRIILGIVLLGAGFATGSLLGLVGLVPLVTAALRWCPVYVPFKIDTTGK